MTRPRTVLTLLGAAAVAGVIVRHVRGPAMGHTVPGGIVMGDASFYDTLSRLMLGSFYEKIANDIADVAPSGAQVLEVRCGPGHLSMELTRHGFDVTGLDLDPAMIERARANAEGGGGQFEPEFRVGDVAALPHPDQSFDPVVSTLSLHHWADPTAGLAEINRAQIRDPTIPRILARPRRAITRLTTPPDERRTVAMALEAVPDTADGTGTRRSICAPIASTRGCRFRFE